MKSASAETGIGWDQNNLCFLASAERWCELIQENKLVKIFSQGANCHVYMLLHSIFDGNTATGSRAKSSATSINRTAARNREKGKAKEGCSGGTGDDDVYVPRYGDGMSVWKNKSCKRPASNAATSSQEGSRPSKSSRTSDDPFIEAATNVSWLCDLRNLRDTAPIGGGGGARASNAKQLFNQRHSSLCNVIERTFGVLKKMFTILSSTKPNYEMDTQIKAVIASCAVHNFIRDEQENDEIFNEFSEEMDVEGYYGVPAFPEFQPLNVNTAAREQWNGMRDAIAQDMWNAYGSRRRS